MSTNPNTSGPLRNDHAGHLAQFHIPPEMLEAAGVRSVTDNQAREMLGLHGHHGADLGGILFPYRSPLTGERVGARIRLDHPLPNASGKYVSEPGCRYLFSPPNVTDLLSDVSAPVVIVEAEKSALALRALADRAGRPMLPVAIGGCWGWRRKIGKRPLPDGGSEPETGPSPVLDWITWEGRSVILAFDSNASANSAVRWARRKLAQELAGRGACVYIGQVPGEPGVNGPDDLIAIAGDEAALRVLDAVQKFDECAFAECEQALAVLEADKKADPLPAIEAIAAIDHVERRALLIGRLVALRLPGATRKFIEERVRGHCAEAEADRKKAAETARRGRLLALGDTIRGAELLDSIYEFVQRFVLLSRAQSRVVTLWLAHTYAFVVAECTPYLSITSPEKRSGKSRLLEVAAILVWKPWYTGRVTAAVLYRKIEAEAPTLLLDESDAAFKSSEEYGEALRGILNTGHRRGGKATCCVGQGVGISYQDFSTFSPKAIAGIGKLPDTVTDRSVPIRLKRKTRADKVERFRLRNAEPEAERLRERLEAWSVQNIEKLREAHPELPEELSDRQQDGAEPLLAIADLAGGEWPQAARHALIELCCGAQAAEDSIGTQLLSDIRQIFKTRDTDRLSSAELTNALAGIETSPWGEWNHGDKPITPIGLARQLRPFDISPHPVRDGTAVFKGYETDDFGDAWARYLGPDGSPAGHPGGSANVTPLQAAPGAASSDFRRVTASVAVTAQKVAKTDKIALCNRVTPSGPSTGAPVYGTEEEL